jgi:succinate dehydrogenase / fumarate reductase cytochrome b subunit
LEVCQAVTGTVFVAFVLFHMLGNLKVYIGADDFNHYAAWLRTLFNPLVPGDGVLWILRVVLVLCLILHVYGAITLYCRARIARGGHGRKLLANRIGARTMIWTGLILLLFIIFHILDLTLGVQPMATSHFVHGDAYQNLIYSFQRPAVAIFYCLAIALLAVHLSHGVWSLISDFGGTGSRLRSLFFIIAGLVAIVLLLGDISIPIAVQIGFLTL